MAKFVCHTCKLYRKVNVGPGMTVPPGSIKCPSCGQGMFWMPKGADKTGLVRAVPPIVNQAPVYGAPLMFPILPPPTVTVFRSSSPTIVPTEPRSSMEDDTEDEDTKAEIADVWTPGQFGDPYANAMRHWNDHRQVNGVTHTSCLSYVRAAVQFAATHKRNRVPQAKNPRVEYTHNCTRTSTQATLVCVNIEHQKGGRIASFYDMIPGRNGKTIQKQLADQIGVDESILFD